MTLIDGDKLADTFKDKLCDHLYCRDCSFQLEDGGCKVEKWLDDAPSIEIVRCAECKHRPIKEDANEADYGFNVIAPNEDERCPCLVEDGWYSWIPKDDFYCGYGEREGE